MQNTPRNLPKRNQHEPPLMQPRMRNFQPLRLHHHMLPARVHIQQDIDVQHPRRILKTSHPPRPFLYPLHEIQKLLRPQLRLRHHARIKESRLIQIPHRRRLIQRGRGNHVHISA